MGRQTPSAWLSRKLPASSQRLRPIQNYHPRPPVQEIGLILSARPWHSQQS